MKQKFNGVFLHKGRIFTVNTAPGKSVYGEKLEKQGDIEFREWVPWRSKLAAAIKNGLKELPLEKGSIVLYLGSSAGTTPSHIADIIGKKGVLFGVEISERAMQKFLLLCNERQNLVPILGDAANPKSYAGYLKGVSVDLLYQDISQKNQAEIFNRNARLFLKKGRHGLIALKAKSISQRESPKKVFAREKSVLEKEFKVKQVVPLNPFEKHHVMVLGEKK